MSRWSATFRRVAVREGLTVVVGRAIRSATASAGRGAGQLPRPEEVVDGIARDAAQELAGFLDRVQGTVLHRHGSLGAFEVSHTVELLAVHASFDG